LIVLAAQLYTEILQMYLNKKNELFGDQKDDEDDGDFNILDMNMTP
jgi:hypothetical protein